MLGRTGARVVLVVLVGSAVIGCGTERATVAAGEECPANGDLRLVLTGGAGEEGGDVFGLTVDGTVRRLTDDGGSYDPALSPDGRHVVFSSIGEDGEVSDEVGPSGLDLHIVVADGSDRRRLLDGDEDVTPAWSPDGHQIAFARRGGSSSQILVVDPDDPTSAEVLVEPPAGAHDTDPAWSPDGKRLAFVRAMKGQGGWRSDTPHRLVVVDVDGSNARTVLERDDRLASPTWSPDSTALAFTLGSGGDRSGSIAVLGLGDGSVDVVGEPARAPVWSASGRLYGYARPPAVTDVSGGWRVTEFSPDDDGFSTGRPISAVEPIGFLYGGFGVDVPRCAGPDAPALTSDADVPDTIRVTDPVTGHDVEVMTREAARSRVAAWAGSPDGDVEAKLVHIDAFQPHHVDPAVGLVWAVVEKGAAPASVRDAAVFDATTGDFLFSGYGHDEPWSSLVDLAP